jgi:hypothetical protein
MNILGKVLEKADAAIEESTQDFVLRSSDHGKGEIPSVSVKFGFNLQQYYCSKLDR